MGKISTMYRRSGGTDYRHLCAECKNLIKGRTCKCKAYGITERSETDWKPQWIACKFYNRKVSPLIKSEEQEIDGQMSVFDFPEVMP